MLSSVSYEEAEDTLKSRKRDNRSWILSSFLLVGAAILLIASSTIHHTQYYVTVQQLQKESVQYIGEPIRLSGAVIGDTIRYNPRTLLMEFEIANLPHNIDNLAAAIREAISSDDIPRIKVHIEGLVMPELLQHGAQAILSGELGEDGIFYATELMLKCPTRFEENDLGTQFIPHTFENQS
ncbi:MAG: cytochrome c maturation protein CcmE [Anaerolineae bacterium]|nr:cytochrome c maturation protein CcmE [Anaerolineae bacterium]